MMEYKALSFCAVQKRCNRPNKYVFRYFRKNYLSLFRGRVAPLIFAGVAQW